MKRELLGLTILFALICSMNALCQIKGDYAIVGRVIDEATGAPLPFATVSLKDKSDGTVTNPDGEFNLFLSEYKLHEDTLVVSHIGYANTYMPVKEALNTAPLLFSLSENVLELEEVQVQVERLDPKQIMQSSYDALGSNHNTQPFISKAFFRDLRDQNQESSYLVEASIEVLDPGLQANLSDRNEKRKMFYLKGVRASNNYINKLLTPVLDRHNFLRLGLEHNFWARKMKSDLLDPKKEYQLEDVVFKNELPLYVVSATDTAAKDALAEQHKDMRFEYTHRYYVDIETYAIHKIEYTERPLEGIYVGIEGPYPGDTLFYSKKGWSGIYEFDRYEKKMYLRYYNMNYAFDVVNSKSKSVYLDVKFNNVFIVTSIETDKVKKPKGIKMNRNKSIVRQATTYEPSFWENQSSARLVPLTQKQISGLERGSPLEEQFSSTPNNK
ncbi:MAG: carboxypeptidase-like regulatory domain-containing protein [Bacteroidota bacterium]